MSISAVRFKGICGFLWPPHSVGKGCFVIKLDAQAITSHSSPTWYHPVALRWRPTMICWLCFPWCWEQGSRRAVFLLTCLEMSDYDTAIEKRFLRTYSRTSNLKVGLCERFSVTFPLPQPLVTCGKFLVSRISFWSVSVTRQLVGMKECNVEGQVLDNSPACGCVCKGCLLSSHNRGPLRFLSVRLLVQVNSQ